MEHEILFHEQTLIFLQQNRNLRRPCTSLRVRGLGCLNQQDQVELLSSFESKSLERAIHRKKCLIEEPKVEFNDVPEREWHLYRELKWNVLNEHRKKLTKKLDWLKHLSSTKFKHWPAKGKEKEENRAVKRSRTVACKAARNRRKREKRRKRALERRIEMVKEQHLVFNLIPPENLTVPDEALAVLSYGEGFVPTPEFNREEFRLQAFNARKKLEWCANNQAKNLQQDINEETPEDINSATELCVPPELKI